MGKNIFRLNNDQLQEIAGSLYEKILTGLEKDNTEIKCIPTYIEPKASGINGKALVLDLGGTNYRAAIVELIEGYPAIHPENGWSKNLSVMKTPGYTQRELFKELADLIGEITEDELPIGYCFSYPAESLLNGDAKLIRWTKELAIEDMIGKPVGESLRDYFNSLYKTQYADVKVVNDTVASLFAGLSHKDYDAYVGLIVGTGVNMATFIPVDKIPKLHPEYKGKGFVPVNLESGNLFPPHLTHIDDEVDRLSADRGHQRFEKAVSGAYLSKILQTTFPDAEFGEKFNTRELTSMLSYPDLYKDEYVETARFIYNRSAHLVAASLTGLVLALLDFNKNLKRVCITAEGSLFWSKDLNGVNYETQVYTKLHELLKEKGYGDIRVDIMHVRNANLIGSAIAALS